VEGDRKSRVHSFDSRDCKGKVLFSGDPRMYRRIEGSLEVPLNVWNVTQNRAIGGSITFADPMQFVTELTDMCCL
jgi:hypothetical protein